jgi:REP element-mobilizing transposase RayT
MSNPRPDRHPRPRIRVEGSAYFVTWRLSACGPPLSPAERDVVLRVLRHFDGARFELLAAVVMDDHVHAVVWPVSDNALDAIVHSWRSFAARELLALGLRRPPVWQRDGFDRVVVEGGELHEKIAYIRNNPWRRWPDVQEYPWLWPLLED